MPSPGEIYALPADESDGHDKDGRPHVVLSPTTAGSRVVTLAYGTSKGVEASLGAPYVVIQKGSSLFTATGLNKTTYFYTSRLVVAYPDELTEKLGVIMDELTDLRANVVPRGLGHGTGTCRESGIAAGSQRGVVVELSALGRQEIGASHAVVTSHPRYSRRNLFLNIVPILDGAKLGRHGPDVVISRDQDWVAQIPGLEGDALVMVQLVQGVYAPTFISRPLGLAADRNSMREIDRGFREHFLADC